MKIFLLVLFTLLLMSACHKDDLGKNEPLNESAISIWPAITVASANIIITLNPDTFIIQTWIDEDVKIHINDIEIKYPWIWKIASNKVGLRIPEDIGVGPAKVRVENAQRVYKSDTLLIVERVNWTRKSDFAGGLRTDAVSFVISEKGYVVAGNNIVRLYDAFSGQPPVNPTGSLSNEVWQYEPSNDIWLRKSDFPGEKRYSAVGFSLRNKGYMGLGYYQDSNNEPMYLKDFWEYDPESDVWIKKADFTGNVREGMIAFTIGKKGYIGLGEGNQLWEYDPDTNIWTQKATFPGEERYHAVSFSIGDKGYVGLGSGQTDFWEYAPVSDSWKQKASLINEAENSSIDQSRSNLISFVINNRGIVGTGFSSYPTFGRYRTDFWEYNPVTNQWIELDHLSGEGRQDAFGFAIGDKAFVGTGFYDKRCGSHCGEYVLFSDVYELTRLPD